MAFEEERGKTSGKMSDLVMEYVSQVIAKDFLDLYDRAGSADLGVFVPKEFDDKIYKKITGFVRKSKKKKFRVLRFVARAAVVLLFGACLVFTIWVLWGGEPDALKDQIHMMVSG